MGSVVLFSQSHFIGKGTKVKRKAYMTKVTQLCK